MNIQNELMAYLQELNNQIRHYEELVEGARGNKEVITEAAWQEAVYQLNMVKFKLQRILEKSMQAGNVAQQFG